MPWLIEAEVADNQNDEPDWADHQRFHGIRFQRQHVDHADKEDDQHPAGKQAARQLEC